VAAEPDPIASLQAGFMAGVSSVLVSLSDHRLRYRA
jgi:hypothetical protein